MKKRLLSLLFMLALCLGLLPVTALAVGEPDRLYVGNQNVKSGEDITYWSTNDSEGLTSVENATDNSDDWNVKYDPNTATLTLKNATIVGKSDDVNIAGTGIYAASRSGAVSLNIVLEGENRVSGGHGINVSSDGGDASLNISGSGSLTVSGLYYNGIGISMSSQSSTNLTIERASVTALGDMSGGCGVQLITSQTGSPSLTIEVKGGSLQASGEKNGIQFLSNANDATAVANLKVSGNAMVKASGITTEADGSGVQLPDLTTEAGTGETGGIVFDGKNGTVYGDVTLQEDLEIGKGETLTIGQDASLTVSQGTTLTNNGTVTTEEGGTLTNYGEIDNSGTLPETISGNQPPKITTTSLPNGMVGKSYTETTLEADNEPTSWRVTGSLPAGLTLNKSTGVISGTPSAAGTSTFTVTATNASGSDNKKFALTVTQPVTGVKLNTDNLSLVEGGAATLTATVAPENATNDTVTWASSNTAIATVDSNGKVTAVAPGTATITATAADGSGQAATCKVTVTAKTYSLSIDPGAIGFGTAAVGYTQPAVREVTVKNTGNQTLTLTHPTAVNFELGKLNQLTLAPGEKAIFTVRPKAGLPRGNYSETVLVAAGSCQASINLTFTVQDGTTAAPVTENRTLHFNTMGGLPMDDVKFGLGAPVELWPYTPVRAGYLFQGWYADEALTQPVGTIVLVKDTTLYAKWAPDPAAQAAAGSGSGSSGSGSGGSGSGSKATPTPSPSPTPQPTATPTPTPAPTATPEPTPEVTPAPEETDQGGFPILPVAAGVVVLAALAGGILWFRRR